MTPAGAWIVQFLICISVVIDMWPDWGPLVTIRPTSDRHCFHPHDSLTVLRVLRQKANSERPGQSSKITQQHGLTSEDVKFGPPQLQAWWPQSQQGGLEEPFVLVSFPVSARKHSD